VNFTSTVPFTYLIRCFTAFQCAGPGLDENLARTPHAYAMSGLVDTAKYIKAPTALRYGISFIAAISSGVLALVSFSNRNPGSMGVETGGESDIWSFSNTP